MSPRRRRTITRLTLRVLDYLVMLAFVAFFLFPIVFMVVASFKPEKLIFDDLQSVVYAFVPRHVTLENYRQVFERVPFMTYMFVSVFVTLTTVGVGLVVNSLAAFALARLRFRGKAVLLTAIVSLMIVPLEAIAVPLLVVVNQLPWFGGATSWLDSYQVQIVPFVAEAFSIYLFYQFFRDIPREFDEAARIDGAGPWRIYLQVVVPLSRPVFATVAILQALVVWGSYLWPLMVTRSQTVRPLTVGITAFYINDVRWGPILAFASMITIPVLIVFLLLQRWFVQSVASSGIKG